MTKTLSPLQDPAPKTRSKTRSKTLSKIRSQRPSPKSLSPLCSHVLNVDCFDPDKPPRNRRALGSLLRPLELVRFFGRSESEERHSVFPA